MGQLPPNAWKWMALIGLLFVPGAIAAYLRHSAVRIILVPGIFLVLMILIVVLLRGEVGHWTQGKNGKG
jgi:hypothetical protein